MTVASQPDSQKASGTDPKARPFAHLNAPLHALYREIMTVFRDSKQRFVVHLRPEDVAEAIWTAHQSARTHISQEDIAEALVKLEEWGNLSQQQEDERRRSIRALLRHPLLTPEGPAYLA